MTQYNIYHLFVIIIFTLMTASCSGGNGEPVGYETSLLPLEWTVPSEREDATALSIVEIQGYRIFYSKTKGSYPYTDSILVNDGSAHQFTIPAQTIPSGKYFIVMTAIDTDGRESYYSDPPLEMTILD